jgi:outer membrane protein, heavy metal efflux system
MPQRRSLAPPHTIHVPFQYDKRPVRAENPLNAATGAIHCPTAQPSGEATPLPVQWCSDTHFSPEIVQSQKKNGLTRRARFVIILLLLGAVVILQQCFGSEAQTNAPVSPQILSLAQAREFAFRRNWDLLAAKSGIDSASAQLIVAKEFPNPTASLSTARIGASESATLQGDGLWQRNYDSIASVSQLIEIGGKRHDRQMAARAGVLGAKARFYDAKRTLDQGVTKAYLAALLAEENARILNESSGYLLREAGIAQARYKAGDISDSDEKQIEINAEQFELQARAAESTAVQARIAVEVLMGANAPKGDWTPAETLPLLVTNADLPTPESIPPDAARPDVLAAEADVRGGKAQLQLQKAMRIPDPTFMVGGEHNPPGGGSPPEGGPEVDTFLIGISFPLPFWNQNRGNIKAAQAAVDQFGDALGKIKTQAMADIATAESAYDEARERWQRYRDQTGPKSRQVRETIAFAYEKGGASLVDLLNAEQTDNTFRLALAQAMNDTASTAADLIAARTVLTETELNLWK